MKRLQKAVILPVRNIAYQRNHLRLYYWAEKELFELQSVSVMLTWYYRWLYHACVWLVEFKRYRTLADRAIHTIPYHIRFEVA